MRFNSRLWPKCRVFFRRVRVVVLATALALICVFIWFNRIGLPDFLSAPLMEKLQARGVNLEFARLRVDVFARLIADDVHIGRAAKNGSVTFSSEQARVELNSNELWHGRLRVDGLAVQNGKFTWPVSETNGITRALVVDHIRAEVRFQTNDTWSFDDFHANFAGANFALSGDIAHAPEIFRQEFFHPKKPANQSTLQRQLEQFYDALGKIHFENAPDLKLFVNGDAREPRSFALRLTVNAPDAVTPWGRAHRVLLAIRARPSDSEPLPRIVLHLEAGEIATPEGGANKIRLEANVSESSNAPAADDSWSFWKNLEPYEIHWTARCSQLQTEKADANFVACGGSWLAPDLVMTNLFARLGDGQLAARARLNVATRVFSFTNSSSFDINAISKLLTEKTRVWLAQFSWPQPPQLQAAGSMILPAWTNRQPDWRREVQPTEQFAGKFSIAGGSFRGIPFDAARGNFSYSKLTWRLPELNVMQSGNQLQLSCMENDATKDYHWRIHGALNPETFRPLFSTEKARRALEQFKSADAAQIDADVFGRLYDYERIGGYGRIMLTNFSFRGQSADLFQTAFSYTNRVLHFFGPDIRRGAQILTADHVIADFNSRRIYFTNGFSTAEPHSVARAIGPKIGRALEPYHFLQPPTVHVNGYAPLLETNDADLTFDVDGGPFEWLKLKTPRIAGEVRWRNEQLFLKNLSAPFYGGNATGSADFNFSPEEGADFHCIVDVTNVSLHLLAVDLTSPTNHLEGLLAAHALITSANTKKLDSLNGYLQAHLRDGLLWEVPIFGILSTPLNVIAPGLGNSRATEATGIFTITNGVFFSDNLEIRSTLMRLQYSGMVDLHQHVNARVNAELLRDTWVIGPLISAVLWPVSKIFEYHITGTLTKPKSQPVYVPKILLMPLHPLRSLEEILPNNTNAPPASLKK